MALIVLLLVVGAAVRYGVVIAVVVGAVWLYRWVKHLDARSRAARDARLAICARADQQHNWVMRGDERGVYGEYPAVRL